MLKKQILESITLPLNRWSFVAISVAVAMAFVACGKKDEKSVKEGAKVGKTADSVLVEVVTRKVEFSSFMDWATYSAEIRGTQDAVLSAGAGGRVNSIRDVGTSVTKGQALCNIETEKYESLYAQAEAAVSLAKGELERVKSSVEKGFIGNAALDKAKLDFHSADVNLIQTKRALQDSRCEAPFSGVLVSRYAENYQTLPPGAPTVRIAQLQDMEAVVYVPENDIGYYKVGQVAKFISAQSSSVIVEGKIKSLDAAVDAKNRTAAVRIALKNKSGVLKPGAVGTGELLRGSFNEAIVIPTKALVRFESGTFVMAVQQGKAKQMPIKLGRTQGSEVHVLEGLEAGTEIITTGAFQVTDGMAVKTTIEVVSGVATSTTSKKSENP